MKNTPSRRQPETTTRKPEIRRTEDTHPRKVEARAARTACRGNFDWRNASDEAE